MGYSQFDEFIKLTTPRFEFMNDNNKVFNDDLIDIQHRRQS